MKDFSFRNIRIRHYSVLFVTSLLSMIFATGVIYFFVRENLIDRSVKDTVSGLRSVMESHISIFEQADAILSTIAADKDIMNLKKLIDSGAYTQSYRAYQQLEAAARQYDFVDYISVYDLAVERVTATKWGLSAIREYPREMIPKLENRGSDRILHIDVLEESDGVQTTLRVGRYFPMGYLFEPKTYLSLTLDTEYLMQLYSSMTPEDGEFFLMDEKQTIIYSSIPVPEEAAQSMDTLQKGKNGVAMGEITIEREKELLIHLFSPGYGLVYSYMIPMRVVTADANFLINILSILFMLIIALLCVAGIFSMRTLFRPIERIRDVVALYEPGEQNTPVPIGDLAQHVRRVYDEYKDLSEHFDQYKQSQKDSFLRQLIAHPPEEKECEAQLSYFKLPFAVSDFFCAAVMSLDKSAKQSGGETILNWDLFSYCMLQTLRDTLTGPVYMESLSGDENDRYLIFCSSALPDGEALTKQLEASITAIHNKVSSDVNLSVTIGLSSFLEGISKLPLCRRQAETARDQRWLDGMNRVILYGEAVEGRQTHYPYEIEKKLLTALKANQQQAVEESLAQFHLYVLRNTQKDVGIGQHYYLQLLSATYRTVYDWCGFCLEALPTEKESYALFVNEPTAEKLQSRLIALYRVLFNEMEKRRSERYVALSAEIKGYIQSHYQLDLSVDSIARALKISSSHLRRVFHEETGESVKGYLDGVRIQKAKELLEQTDLLIGDISLKTGYVSVQTFSRVFKKETGATPGEYRRQLCPDWSGREEE